MKIAFVNMATVVTNRVRNIESEIVATLYSSHAKQLTILRLGKMFLQIEM